MDDIYRNDNIYEVTWRVPFWGMTETALHAAPDIQTAVVTAPDVSASGYPIHRITGPDGDLTRECDDDNRMRDVEFLLEVDGALVEEHVSAPDLSTAFDILYLVVDPSAELRGVHAEGRRLHLHTAPDGFWDHPDLPDEWVCAT